MGFRVWGSGLGLRPRKLDLALRPLHPERGFPRIGSRLGAQEEGLQ